jgi:tetratricopeptide (TPR) repeat protein
MIIGVDKATAMKLLAEAEVAAPALGAHGSGTVLADLERHYPELLHAIDWFLAAGEVDEARRLVIALGPFWRKTGLMEKSVTWFDRVLAPAVGSDELLGEALYEAAEVAFDAGDDVRASSHYRHAIAVARQAAHAELAARALVGLAQIAMRSNNLEGARRFCREALAVAATSPDPLAAAGAYRVLAVAAQVAGDLDEAHEQMNQQVELGRHTGNLAVVSSALGDISELERQRGNLDLAEAAALEALEIDERRGDEWSVLIGINAVAGFLVQRGLYERAAMLVGAAEVLVERQAEPWPPGELAQFEVTVGVLESSMDARAMEFARATGRDMSRREAVELSLSRPISDAATPL